LWIQRKNALTEIRPDRREKSKHTHEPVLVEGVYFKLDANGFKKKNGFFKIVNGDFHDGIEDCEEHWQTGVQRDNIVAPWDYDEDKSVEWYCLAERHTDDRVEDFITIAPKGTSSKDRKKGRAR